MVVITWTNVLITIITIYRKQPLARGSFYGYRQKKSTMHGVGHNDKEHVHSVETRLINDYFTLQHSFIQAYHSKFTVLF